MRGRGRGLAAAAGLLAMVVGIPVIVTALDGGPPTGIPSWAGVVRALDRPITDHDVLRVVAVLAWAVWLLFCVAVAIEAVAVVRHRPGPAATRRGPRIPGLQGVAASLVLAVVLALSNRPPPAALIGAGPGTPPPVTAVLPIASVQTGSSPAPPGSSPVSARADAGAELSVRRAVSVAPASPPWLRYTVVRYDSPWAIAEHHLGNGLRWREIRDDHGDSLIEGSDEDDGPGMATIDTTARIIYPGQVLLLPPDATG
ncbi:MAG: hypothetical protein M3Y36_03310, partial [Actinomycetota bacterium]|nr:hypothetical protein [Actinomycetota bacterium]